MTEIILDLLRRTDGLLHDCELLEIEDDASYLDADKGMSRSLNVEKEIKRVFEEKKEEPRELLKALQAQEKTMLTAIGKACTIITQKMDAYENVREEGEEEKRVAYQKEMEEKTLQDAFRLAEEGVPQHAIDAVVEQSKSQIANASIPELRGKTKFSVAYEVQIISGAEDSIPRNILSPTSSAMIKALEAKIKAMVKLEGDAMFREKYEGSYQWLKIRKTKNARRRE